MIRSRHVKCEEYVAGILKTAKVNSTERIIYYNFRNEQIMSRVDHSSSIYRILECIRVISDSEDLKSLIRRVTASQNDKITQNQIYQCIIKKIQKLVFERDGTSKNRLDFFIDFRSFSFPSVFILDVY